MSKNVKKCQKMSNIILKKKLKLTEIAAFFQDETDTNKISVAIPFALFMADNGTQRITFMMGHYPSIRTKIYDEK